MRRQTKLIILGNDKQLRDEIRSNLKDSPSLDILGAYPVAWDPLKIIEQHNPNIILLSIPEIITSELKLAISKISKRNSTDILALISRENPAAILELMLQGINGFILEKDWRNQLLRSINLIKLNGIAIPPSVAKEMIEFLRNPVVQEKSDKLTSKEFQVLSEIRRGRSYREVADLFNIGESTIRTHCKSIYRKLGVRGRIEAINTVFLNPGLRNTFLHHTA